MNELIKGLKAGDGRAFELLVREHGDPVYRFAVRLIGEREAVSDSNGVYYVTGLPAGTYRVAFALTSFQSAAREGVQVNIGAIASIDATMSLESIKETVTVTAQMPSPLAQASTTKVRSKRDIDVLEACLVSGIKVDDPPPDFSVTFDGWLTANVDHRLRNQDIVASSQDERFQFAISQALGEALACRGGTQQRGYRQAGGDTAERWDI